MKTYTQAHNALNETKISEIYDGNHFNNELFSDIYTIFYHEIEPLLTKGKKNEEKHFIYNMIYSRFINHNSLYNSILGIEDWELSTKKCDRERFIKTIKIQHKRKYEDIYYQNTNGGGKGAYLHLLHEHLKNHKITKYGGSITRKEDFIENYDHIKDNIKLDLITDLIILDKATEYYNYLNHIHYTQQRQEKNLLLNTLDYIRRNINIEDIFDDLDKNILRGMCYFKVLINGMKDTIKNKKLIAKDTIYNHLHIETSYKLNSSNIPLLFKDIREHYKTITLKKELIRIRPIIHDELLTHHRKRDYKLVLHELEQKTSYKVVAFNSVNNMIFTATNNILNTFRNYECSICYESIDINNYHNCKICSAKVCSDCYNKCKNHNHSKKCVICRSDNSVQHITPNQPQEDNNIITSLEQLTDEEVEILNYIYKDQFEELLNQVAVYHLELLYHFNYHYLRPYLRNITEEQYNQIQNLEDNNLIVLLFREGQFREFVGDYITESNFFERVEEYVRENDDIYNELFIESIEGDFANEGNLLQRVHNFLTNQDDEGHREFITNTIFQQANNNHPINEPFVPYHPINSYYDFMFNSTTIIYNNEVRESIVNNIITELDFNTN